MIPPLVPWPEQRLPVACVHIQRGEVRWPGGWRREPTLGAPREALGAAIHSTLCLVSEVAAGSPPDLVCLWAVQMTQWMRQDGWRWGFGVETLLMWLELVRLASYVSLRNCGAPSPKGSCCGKPRFSPAQPQQHLGGGLAQPPSPFCWAQRNSFESFNQNGQQMVLLRFFMVFLVLLYA